MAGEGARLTDREGGSEEYTRRRSPRHVREKEAPPTRGSPRRLPVESRMFYQLRACRDRVTHAETSRKPVEDYLRCRPRAVDSSLGRLSHL